MRIYSFVGLIIQIASLRVVWSGDSEITKFLKGIEVILDSVPEDSIDFLKVSYDSGVFANKGVELTPTQVKNQPFVDWNSRENVFYTLMMIHSEKFNITGPLLSQFHHWLVVNIPGTDVGSGQIISEYLSSGPSKGSGLHLYVFLLYKQPKRIDFEEKLIKKESMVGRSNFSAIQFAAKYDLGSPLAANYYEAQYDDYVPTVHAQIGILNAE